NDLLDLEEDRRHPDKRQRPLAAGTLPSAWARIAIPLLLLASLALGMLLPVSFLYSMLAYLTLAAAYTLLFRGLAVVDVLVLAVLFVLRITAGAGAVSVPPSPWLLVFCLFLFLNLALLKRYTELRGLLARGDQVSRVRGYSAQDLPLLKRFGFCSGLAAVLVLALYTTSDWVHTLYSRPVLLWLLCPLLVHMLVRLWQRARRDELHEDPVVFVITDRPGQLLAAVGVILLWLAS
ncbi:MAG: UbiA family prenyltransferase, partial [Chromatocurvus sp.]